VYVCGPIYTESCQTHDSMQYLLQTAPDWTVTGRLAPPARWVLSSVWGHLTYYALLRYRQCVLSC